MEIPSPDIVIRYSKGCKNAAMRTKTIAGLYGIVINIEKSENRSETTVKDLNDVMDGTDYAVKLVFESLLLLQKATKK